MPPAPQDSAARVPMVARWTKVSTPSARWPPTSSTRRPTCGQRAAVEPPRPHRDRRMRERRRRPPPTRPRLGERLRRRVVALEPDDGRLVIEAVALALEPAIEEPHDLVELVEVRTRVGVVRPAVDPVADERPRRRRARRLHPERRVDVGVAPAADVEDRRLDRVVVGGERARSPVRPVGLVPEPGDEPRRRQLEARPPLVEPAGAAEPDVGRHRVHRDLADPVLRELARGHAAADVVDVGQVAVVGPLERRDGEEMRRSQLGDLDRRERAVADAPHPDGAAAPGLGGEPLDGVVPVAGLVLGVLVHRDARRRSGPADVDPDEGIAPGREPLAAADVGVASPVVLAVGDQLEDGREPGVGVVARSASGARCWPTARCRRGSGSGRPSRR